MLVGQEAKIISVLSNSLIKNCPYISYYDKSGYISGVVLSEVSVVMSTLSR